MFSSMYSPGRLCNPTRFTIRLPLHRATGSPWQNAGVESFGSLLSEEMLSTEQFRRDSSPRGAGSGPVPMMNPRWMTRADAGPLDQGRHFLEPPVNFYVGSKPVNFETQPWSRLVLPLHFEVPGHPNLLAQIPIGVVDVPPDFRGSDPLVTTR